MPPQLDFQFQVLPLSFWSSYATCSCLIALFPIFKFYSGNTIFVQNEKEFLSMFCIAATFLRLPTLGTP